MFSLTWPASTQFIGTKQSVYIRKEFNSHKIGLGTPPWPPFHCFGTPLWPPWRHVKTLYRPLPSCHKPLFQSEAKLEAINMKMTFSQQRFYTWPRLEGESV